MLSNIIKINSKNNLINNYYSILIYNIQKQKKTHLITINLQIIQILPLEHRDTVVSARNDPFGYNKI